MTSGGSSQYQLVSTYRNENLNVDSTRTMTQCMSLHNPDQGFPNSIEGWGEIAPSGGVWKTLLREFNLYGSGKLRRIDFDHLNPFQS